MDLQVTEKALRERILTEFDHSKAINDVFIKIKDGTATYDDAQSFAENLGDVISKAFSETIDDETLQIDPAELADQIVGRVLVENQELVATICDIVQSNLNQAAGLGIESVNPGINAQGIVDIQNAVKASQTAGEMKVALGNPIPTLSQSLVDAWVMQNADFLSKIGQEAVVVRRWSGQYGSHDTKHTDWCHALAGVYTYSSNMDKRVFVRHQGCRCSVSYYPRNSVKGKISALPKGEKDTTQVLWNTGEITSYSRKAVRRREIASKGKKYVAEAIKGQ